MSVYTEKHSIYTSGFWKDLGERSVSTFAQVAGGFVAAAIASSLEGQSFLEFDWTTAAFVILASTLLAVLKGVGAVNVSPDSGASLGTAVPKERVAAVEQGHTGQYVAEEAAPYAEGTPVEVVPDFDQDADNGYRY